MIYQASTASNKKPAAKKGPEQSSQQQTRDRSKAANSKEGTGAKQPVAANSKQHQQHASNNMQRRFLTML